MSFHNVACVGCGNPVEEHVIGELPLCDVCVAAMDDTSSLEDDQDWDEFDDWDRDLDDEADPGDMDGDFDTGMASAGFGTDEDYGYFGDE